MYKKIGIITSGGDSPGMNAAIYSIIKYSKLNNINCVGFKYGYDGLINNNLINLFDIKIDNIIGLGGTVLGSGRSEYFLNKIGRVKAYNNIKKNKLDAIIIIGGNGSLEGAQKFSKEFDINIICIPGTIDNDIFGTESIGYDTCLNTIIDSIEKIKDTAISNNRIFIIEVMGRNSPFLALKSGLAIGALGIFLNKKKYKIVLNNILNKIENKLDSNIIIVAENNVIGKFSKKIYKIFKKKTKKYEFRHNILGHIQRGGNPTCKDRILAIKLGLESIKNIINNQKNIIVGLKNNKIKYIPLKKFKIKKKKNKSLINIYNKFYKV
ncbi:MAG: 6-phosphofructokinase [Candidatus Shikimatogenerans bostrichidophilus]|nr:MAG: 6-phosphofructokinase [Candidatus Shikimatogenerans bostrichidophilus]